MTYSLSPRKILRAEPEGFLKGSGYTSPYILTQVIIQTLSISENYTSSIVLPGWAILVELFSRIALAAGSIFFIIRPAQPSMGTKYVIEIINNKNPQTVPCFDPKCSLVSGEAAYNIYTTHCV